MSLGPGEVAMLAAAGFAGGAVNAAAGGGTLITFPALLAVGYPALDANVTNTVALCPGYLGGVVGYRAELSGQRARALPLALAVALGSVAGAGLLAVSSREVFRTVAPVLVLLASLLLAIQPVVARRLGSADARAASGRPRAGLLVAVALAGVYGAYFGAALGVILLAVLGSLLIDGLQRLNALKGVLSLVCNWLAAAFFIAFAPVHWAAVAALAPAGLLGGRAGVAVARRVPDRVLRAVVVAFGLVVGGWLLVSG